MFSVYEGVLVHILQAAQPQSHFSICVVSSPGERTAIPFDPAREDRILARSGARRELFVPPKDLRIPAGPEDDPRDASGHMLRGVESLTTGHSVELYTVSGLRAIGPDTLEVHYEIYSGPLAARGGVYRVRVDGTKLVILERMKGWES